MVAEASFPGLEVAMLRFELKNSVSSVSVLADDSRLLRRAARSGTASVIAVVILSLALTAREARAEPVEQQTESEVLEELTPELAGLAEIARRYREEILAPSFSDARKLMRSIQPNGSWGDIEYDTGEIPYGHLSRCLEMFGAYRKPGHKYEGSDAMLDAARRAFHYWMQEDWQDWNWWDNQIGATAEAAKVMLLGRGLIAPGDWAKGLEVLRRAWPPPDNSLGRGQNLVYRVNQTILRGVLEDDPAVVRDAMQRTGDEIRVPAAEGIQVDWSFHQHGPQLYWGGYGQGFSSDVSSIALKVTGTPYALTPEKLDLIVNLVLDGQRWAIRGRALDFGVSGRGITRPGYANAGAQFAGICDRLVQSDPSRQAELKTMERAIQGEAGGEPISGNRHFFTSDFMVHHRPGYYTSFKMASKRVRGTESGNGEGLRNFHIPDGATWIYRDGTEYDDILPVLDWRQIPGITCEQYRGEIPLCEWGEDSWSDTEWAGGASDGKYGAATFHLKRLNVEARKAAFYFDDLFVLLGTGISCSGEDPVLTSINQCVLKGDVTVRDRAGVAATVISPGEHTYTKAKWVHHDGVGYVPLGDGSWTVKIAAQTGSRHAINRTYSTETLSMDVFSAWINHGVRPEVGSYAYAVVPGIEAAELDQWTQSPPVKVLANSEAVQAVRDEGSGVTGAAFMRAGTVEIDEAFVVSVDQPCVAVLREEGDRFRIAIANPENKALTVHMSVTRKLQGKDAEWIESEKMSRLTFDLPAGEHAGQSVVKEYKIARASGVGGSAK